MLSKVCLFLGVAVTLSSALRSHCNEDSDCHAPNTVCKLDWHDCQCRDGFTENNEYTGCVKMAERVEDSCKDTYRQCEKLGERIGCEQDKCVCQIGYMPNHDGTDCVEEPKRKIGQPCSRGEQCVGQSGYNSGCTSTGMCACRSNYIPSAALDDCLDVAYGKGSSCTESHQCQLGQDGDKLACVYSRDNGGSSCTCNDDYTISLDNYDCVPKAKAVGDACEIHEQCFSNLKHSWCFNGTCQCMSPFHLSASTGKCEGTGGDHQESGDNQEEPSENEEVGDNQKPEDTPPE